LWLAGDLLIALLTSLEPVQAVAQAYLPLCALYVLLSFAAFQLDGIFLGTTRTRPLRNGALLAVGLFALFALPLTQAFGNDGLWWAFIGFVVVRALVLGMAWRRTFATLAP
jgi:MATE family multidrug resistance protein